VLGGELAEEEVKTIWLFFAVVEQLLKKCFSDKLVLGCFSCLEFAASAD
jgi:hypothetical protein